MIVLVQLVFTIGLALFLSAMTVHFRDLKDLLSNLVQFWFFATPIIYPMTSRRRTWRGCLNLNPMTHMMRSYQEVLFFDGPARTSEMADGARRPAVDRRVPARYFVFDRLRDSFAEEV